MKYLMTAAALCLGLMTAQAQTGKTAPMVPASHNCLSNTTDQNWKDLGLTAEQTTKVKAIQSESMKTSEKMKSDNMGTKTSPMMDKYESQVKEVLKPEQYDKWVKECSTRASVGKKQMDTKPANEEPEDKE